MLCESQVCVPTGWSTIIQKDLLQKIISGSSQAPILKYSMFWQVLQSSGGRKSSAPLPPQKSFLSMCPFFRRALEVPILKEVTNNVYEKLIFYASKLQNTLLIRFYQVENIKFKTLFNSIVNALGWMDIPLTDRKVGCYDRQGLI